MASDGISQRCRYSYTPVFWAKYKYLTFPKGHKMGAVRYQPPIQTAFFSVNVW